MIANMKQYLFDRIHGVIRILRFPKVDMKNLTPRQKRKLRHGIVWGTVYGALGVLAISVIFGHVVPVILSFAWIEFFLIANLTDPALKEKE